MSNMNRTVFRYIEHELYSYDQTKQDIADLRDSIIGDTALTLREAVSGTGPSDPTAKRATKLVTNVALARMTRTITAIDKALALLNSEHTMLFNLRYRQALPWQNVCQDMPISERSYFRLRRELIMAVGVELGLVDSVASGWRE